jgi:hypothetical protein
LIGYSDTPAELAKCGPVSAAMPTLDGLSFDEWHELLAGYRELGPTGKQILMMLMRRLVAGKRAYADDFDRKRNWPRETSEEISDALVYILCGQIKASEGYGEK